MAPEVDALAVLKLLCDNMQISILDDGLETYLLQIKLNDDKMERFIRWLLHTADAEDDDGL